MDHLNDWWQTQPEVEEQHLHSSGQSSANSSPSTGTQLLK